MSYRIVSILVCIGLFAWGAESGIRQKVDEQSYATIDKSNGLHLDVKVANSSELEPAIRIYTGVLDGKKSIKSLGLKMIGQNRVLIPFNKLTPPFRRSLVRALWPKDEVDGDVWVHRVVYRGNETLWTLAELFTGSGSNYKAILKVNGKKRSDLAVNERIRIPLHMMLPAFQPRKIDPQIPSDPVTILPPVQSSVLIEESVSLPKPTDPQGKSTAPADILPTHPVSLPHDELDEGARTELEQLRKLRELLQYGEDSQGKYAVYRLQRGEAIYSAVVVRFCGLISGEEVNREAQNIIRRNGIRDETDMAVGTPIKIPYELLQPEFKALDDSEYQAYIANLEAVGSIDTDSDARNLEGIYIVLDAGHGGRDSGAKFGDVWEDDYVYDIVCRIKTKLEAESKAVVMTTVHDPSVGYRTQDVNRFILDTDEHLLTTPHYPLSDANVTRDGVNLRWMMANHHYEKLTQKGVRPNNMVFASFHADSLHSSIRGSMVYIPDARYSPREVGPPSPRLSRYAEYKGNQFSVSKKELETAQARSLVFAQKFLNHLRKADLIVHPDKPIRSVVLRRAKSTPFVPAVIRNNRMPTRCLVEVCNLNNSHDRQKIKDPQYRQAVADGFVAALYEIYGDEEPSNQPVVTSVRAAK
ncbi:MAG: N-acetylmuramoyl-L-alanine amidase [Acidobacteria bacterium]|nr:N-acetylmuramoyl-L-alanine amidase [Acidobacteriota bacterium]MCB9396871.1 N-acetylmuramoyl-L-alanine amidase [Acidobacteriota bacterium]